MISLRCIVVPTDFSPTADVALATARSYASADTEIRLLHVLQITEYVLGAGLFVWTDDLRDAAKADAQRALEERADSLRTAGFRCAIDVVPGVPEETIPAYAGEKAADLLVMGTHGRKGLSRVALGSVAERVVTASPCPVLLVRHPGSKSE